MHRFCFPNRVGKTRFLHERVDNDDSPPIGSPLAYNRCDSVEYQLAAQKMRPDLFVVMAAYDEYAPGYICMKEHYKQGGYEDSPCASHVAPEVEDVLMPAMKELLK